MGHPGSHGRPRLPHIEGLRAVAALAVVGTHLALLSGFTAANALGPLTARLNVGVAIFFVLSAYLLYGPWVEARLNGRGAPSVRRYAARRALRILPAYWVALAVLGLLLPAQVPGVFGDKWWAYFGLLQVYSQRTVILGIGVAWSLSTEVAFYVVLPVLAWVAARALARLPRERQVRIELVALAVSALVAFAARQLVADQGWMATFSNTAIGKWPWFAVGLGLAVTRAAWGGRPSVERPALVRGIARHAWVGWAVAAAVLLFAAFGGVLPRDAFAESTAQSQLETFLFAVFALALVAPVVLGDPSSPRTPARILALRPIVWLGTVSYGIFLWHLPLATWTRSWIPGSAWLYAAVTVAMSLACAAASWYAIERPALRLGAGRSRSPAALAAIEAREPAP